MIKYQIGKLLAQFAGIIARLAIYIAGNGMVRIEVSSEPTPIDWDAIGGAFILAILILIFWFITP